MTRSSTTPRWCSRCGRTPATSARWDPGGRRVTSGPGAGGGGAAGLVLAAGAARRFGGPKQLAELDGRPLLEHALAALSGLDRIVVVLGARADEIRAGADLGAAV